MLKMRFFIPPVLGILIICCACSANGNVTTSILEHRIYYYPMVPYLYEEQNQTKGLLREIIENAMVYCIERAHGIKMKFHWYKRFRNHGDYINFLESPFFDPKIFQSRIPEFNPLKNDYLWLGPFMSLEVNTVVNENNTYEWVNRGFEMAISPGAYVIVNRDRVSWKGKLVVGIKDCQNYLALAILLCMCSGMLVYLIESRYGASEFGKSISDGAWNGLWWAFVTMSTIGYGDIVPHTRTGRMISLFWLLFGVIMGSIITATFTNAMFSISSIRISGKKVAVLRHSWEKTIAEAHGGQKIEFDSYEEAIQAVRDDKVFAAVINADYVQWHQDDMQNGSKALAIGYLIDITIPVRMNVIIRGNIAEIWNCLDRFRNEIIETPRRKYFRYVDIESTHLVSLREMLYEDTLGFGLAATTTIIIICCFSWFLLEKFYYKKQTSFADAWKHFRDKNKNVKGDSLSKESAAWNHRVSFGETNFINNHLKQNGGGLVNPNFQMIEENRNRGLSERFQKMEEDLDFVKRAISKMSNNKRTESFSHFLAS